MADLSHSCPIRRTQVFNYLGYFNIQDSLHYAAPINSSYNWPQMILNFRVLMYSDVDLNCLGMF
jgi:hypothetical protein